MQQRQFMKQVVVPRARARPPTRQPDDVVLWAEVERGQDFPPGLFVQLVAGRAKSSPSISGLKRWLLMLVRQAWSWPMAGSV
jgi:hypothetical protein